MQLAAAHEGHRRCHKGLEQHVGFKRQISHLQHRLTHQIDVDQRLDLNLTVGLRHAFVIRPANSLIALPISIWPTAMLNWRPSRLAGCFRQACHRMLRRCVGCRIGPRSVRCEPAVIDDAASEWGLPAHQPERLAAYCRHPFRQPTSSAWARSDVSVRWSSECGSNSIDVDAAVVASGVRSDGVRRLSTRCARQISERGFVMGWLHAAIRKRR